MREFHNKDWYIMSQTKNRKKETAAFLASLSNEERIVFDLSELTYKRIIRGLDFKGACYHMTFFLKTVLRQEHGIESNAVVGFVNDGTDDIMISHGWLEFSGRKIDITLANLNHGQRPGPVLILDQKFQEHNTANYSYYYERGDVGDRTIKKLLISNNPQCCAIVQQKEREHNLMVEIGSSKERIMEYLNHAPNGVTYDRLLQLLKQ